MKNTEQVHVLKLSLRTLVYLVATAVFARGF